MVPASSLADAGVKSWGEGGDPRAGGTEQVSRGAKVRREFRGSGRGLTLKPRNEIKASSGREQVSLGSRGHGESARSEEKTWKSAYSFLVEVAVLMGSDSHCVHSASLRCHLMMSRGPTSGLSLCRGFCCFFGSSRLSPLSFFFLLVTPLLSCDDVFLCCLKHDLYMCRVHSTWEPVRNAVSDPTPTLRNRILILARPSGDLNAP